MLAAAGGCFSLNRDPDTDYEHARTVPPAQARAVPSTWYAGTAEAAAAPPAGSAASVQARASAYVPPRPRLPARPVPADAVAEAVPAAAPSGDEVIDENLVQATRVVASRLYSEPAAKPAAPPPSPGRDVASLPLPRIVNGKVPEPAAATVLVPVLAPPAVAVAAATPPPSPTLRLVSSRRISFNYEVKDSADVAAVDLWGTQDLKTWKKFETVIQGNHAIVADLKDEGMYGFTLLPRTAGSTGADHPQPGDLPQVWVAVDCTRPVVQFLGAELNLTASTPTVILRWSAKDRNFGPHPLTLSYAQQPEGPWMQIAANVENTGRYEWTLPLGVPPTLHVRVHAVDLMGNASSGQTTTPLRLPQSLIASAVPVVPSEKADRPSEPEQPTLPPQRVVLPPTPVPDLPRPPVVETPRPQISITSVEVDRGN
jgi:hypothetical protein